MSVMKQLRATEVKPATVLLSLVIFLAATAGVIAVVLRVLNGAPSPPGTSARRTPAHVAGAPAQARGDAPAGKLLAIPGDYGVIVTRDLFRPVGGVAPAAPPPPAAPPLPPADPPPISPFSPFGTTPSTPRAPTITRPSLALTGVVEIAGESYALIEQNDVHLAQYTRVGGVAFGCTVTAIAAREATLAYSGETFTLRIGENKVEAAPAPTTAAAGTTTPATETPGERPGGRPGGRFRPGGSSGDASGERPLRPRFNRPGETTETPTTTTPDTTPTPAEG